MPPRVNKYKLKIYDRNITIFVLNPWKYVTVDLDGNGYFSWFQKHKFHLNGAVNIPTIYNGITSGINCKDLPYVPALPMNGKIENMFALPAGPNINAEMHFFLCSSDRHFDIWMEEIFRYSPSAAGFKQLSSIPRNPHIPPGVPSQFSQIPIANGGIDLRTTFPMLPHHEQQQLLYDVSVLTGYLQQLVLDLPQHNLQQGQSRYPREQRHRHYKLGTDHNPQPHNSHMSDQPEASTSQEWNKYPNNSEERIARKKVKSKKETSKRKKHPQICISIGTINVENMADNCRRAAYMVERRGLDFCCLQEANCKDNIARNYKFTERIQLNTKTYGNYKFFGSHCNDEMIEGVGILMTKNWAQRVVEVKRFNDRVIMVKVKQKNFLLNLFSVYTPEIDEPAEEKERFYERLEEIITRINKFEFLFICGDFKGQVGHNALNYGLVHGGKSFGDRTTDGELLLKFAKKMDLVVANTWFMKPVKNLITLKSGDSGKVVDYILTRRQDRMWLRDVTTMANESCLVHKRLLICTMDVDTLRRVRAEQGKKDNPWRENWREVEEREVTA